ncbi:MAG: type II toxin-antitoxin system HicB family antitoxin [Verrucomicrobia bacterium]|nr:type II toxin-antitoxin system HicB family antitoxin [Verrucomicrobiota bacterium]
MKLSVTVDRDEDGMWVVECPSVPGCVSQGKTKPAALKNIKEAIEQCLEVRAERGHLHNLQIRVLVCREEGQYLAHGLEMDLLGYGATEDEALRELTQAVQSQISFARQKKDDRLILFPAEKEYFDRWEAARTAALR